MLSVRSLIKWKIILIKRLSIFGADIIARFGMRYLIELFITGVSAYITDVIISLSAFYSIDKVFINVPKSAPPRCNISHKAAKNII